MLVLDYQGATVEGRHIQDLCLIANELPDYRLLLKEEGLMFKLDSFQSF